MRSLMEMLALAKTSSSSAAYSSLDGTKLVFRSRPAECFRVVDNRLAGRNMDYNATDIEVTYDHGRDLGRDVSRSLDERCLVARERSAHQNAAISRSGAERPRRKLRHCPRE